jgi:hypothetical protein
VAIYLREDAGVFGPPPADAAPEGEAALAPVESLDGFGRAAAPPPAASTLTAPALETTIPSPRHPPGWYGMPGADSAYRRALNLGAALSHPLALAPAPPQTRLLPLESLPTERDLGPWLLAVALVLLAADLLVSLRLRGLLVWRAAALALALALPAQAQTAPEGAPALATRLDSVRLQPCQNSRNQLMRPTKNPQRSLFAVHMGIRPLDHLFSNGCLDLIRATPWPDI